MSYGRWRRSTPVSAFPAAALLDSLSLLRPIRVLHLESPHSFFQESAPPASPTCRCDQRISAPPWSRTSNMHHKYRDWTHRQNSIPLTATKPTEFHLTQKRTQPTTRAKPWHSSAPNSISIPHLHRRFLPDVRSDKNHRIIRARSETCAVSHIQLRHISPGVTQPRHLWISQTAANLTDPV
jgi:hypothetical protein